jgi:hypothetical protein
MGIEEFVREAILNHYRAGDCDRYGQLKVGSVYTVFKDRAKEAMEWLDKNPIHTYGSYSGGFGVYQGLSNYSGKDSAFLQECHLAFKENSGRLNCNNW